MEDHLKTGSAAQRPGGDCPAGERVPSKGAARAFLAVFLLLLTAVPVWTLLGPREYVSYYEQRTLSPAPALTAARLWDGTFFTDAETALSDHLAWRDEILKADTAAQLALGRPKVNDLVVDSDKLLTAYGYTRWGLDYLAGQAAETAANYGALNALVTGYGGYFCYLGFPLQSSYFSDHYPDYMESRLWHTGAIRREFAAAMAGEGVPFLSMYEVYEQQGMPEAYYFATDHHCTMDGAFLAAQRALERLSADTGLPLALSPEDFTRTQLPNPFLGSSNRKLYGLWENEDAAALYAPKAAIPFTRTDGGMAAEPTVFALPETDTENVTYSVYMGGDLPETVIETNRPELPRLLLYGDSFTNPLETVLWTAFDETRCLDLRYYDAQSLEAYIEAYRPDVVLCVRDETTFLSSDGNGQT